MGFIFFNVINVFSNFDSDVFDDIDVVFEMDFEYCELLEIELFENLKEYFEELDSEFMLIRYEYSCFFYSNDDNSEYFRIL